jgi:PAS domain S-box-containing protein
MTFLRFAEASGRGFGMADLEGCITYVNPMLSRLLGEEKPEDTIGKRVSTYYPEEYKQKWEDEMTPAVLRDGSWQGEQVVLSRHGTRTPTFQSTFLIRDDNGNPFRFAAVIADISERKRAEEALRQSRDELQAIYDGMNDGLLIADAETERFVRVNSSICRMLGYSETELLSASVKDIHPAEVLELVHANFRALAEGRLRVAENVPVRRKDGAVFYADISNNNMVYNGRPCLVGIFRDITERKNAQESLERQHRTLKHLLQASDHERQLIAYEIHDELAQLLAGAIMHLDASAHLKDAMPKKAADAFHKGTTMLRQGHAEVRRLISDVRPPILDAEGVVAAVAHLVNEEEHRKSLRIEYLSDGEFERMTPILENAIYRIVQEALNNACRHSKSEQVRVELTQQGELVRIKVCDEGVGFRPEEIRESHFGVAGIRERARLLGGTAVIDSEPGKGTRIVVALPIVLRREEDDE